MLETHFDQFPRRMSGTVSPRPNIYRMPYKELCETLGLAMVFSVETFTYF